MTIRPPILTERSTTPRTRVPRPASALIDSVVRMCRGVPAGRTVADAHVPAPMRDRRKTNRINVVRRRIASPLPFLVPCSQHVATSFDGPVSRERAKTATPAASKVDDHIQAAKACPRTLPPPFGELLEELCLREHGVPELLDQHALIRRVDIAEPVGRAKEQDLSFGNGGVQRVDERDRAARRDLYGRGAPRR